MKDCNSYTKKIHRRIWALWGILLFMLVYMVVVGELGGGDSRFMTPLADLVSRVIFFGGMICVIWRLIYNKKLLKDRQLLQQQRLLEQDERNQYLHSASGGIVMDILLFVLLFVTCTAAMFSMEAFYAVFTVLVVAVGLKVGVYFIYRKVS